MIANYTIRVFQVRLKNDGLDLDITSIVGDRPNDLMDPFVFGQPYKRSGRMSVFAPYIGPPPTPLNPRDPNFQFKRGATIEYYRNNTQGQLTLQRSFKLLEAQAIKNPDRGYGLELQLGCRLALLDTKGQNKDNVTGTSCVVKKTPAQCIEAIANAFGPTLDLTFDLGNLPTTLIDLPISLTGSQTAAQQMQMVAGASAYVLWDDNGVLRAARQPLKQEYTSPDLVLSAYGFEAFDDIVQPEQPADVIYADGILRYTAPNCPEPTDFTTYGPWQGTFTGITIDPAAWANFPPDFFTQIVPRERVVTDGCPRDGYELLEISAMRGTYYKLRNVQPADFTVGTGPYITPLGVILANPDDLGLKLRERTEYLWDSPQFSAKLLKKTITKTTEIGGAIANLVMEPDALLQLIGFGITDEIVFERITTEYKYVGEVITEIKTTTEELFANATGFTVYAISLLGTYRDILLDLITSQIVTEQYREVADPQGRFELTTTTQTAIGASQGSTLNDSFFAVSALVDRFKSLSTPITSRPKLVSNAPATEYRPSPCTEEEQRLSCEYAPPTTAQVPVKRAEAFDPIDSKSTLDRLAQLEYELGQARAKGYLLLERPVDDLTAFSWTPFRWMVLPDPDNPLTHSLLCQEQSTEYVPEDTTDSIDTLAIAYARFPNPVALQPDNPVLTTDAGVPKLLEYAPQYLYKDVPIAFPIPVRIEGSSVTPVFEVVDALPAGLLLIQVGQYGWIVGTPTVTGIPTTTIRDAVTGVTTVIQWAIAAVGNAPPDVPTPANPTPAPPPTDPVIPAPVIPQYAIDFNVLEFSTADTGTPVFVPRIRDASGLEFSTADVAGAAIANNIWTLNGEPVTLNGTPITIPGA